MKTYKNLYTQIYTFDNLYTAFRNARAGKRSRVDLSAGDKRHPCKFDIVDLSGLPDLTGLRPRFPPPFVWDEDRRAVLRAELAYVLDTFPIVERKDEAQYEEYRTKRMVLEKYEEIEPLRR